MASIEIHYGNTISPNHTMHLLELSSAIQNLQRSITRSYLYHKHGTVWKHARTPRVDLNVSAFEVSLNSISSGGFRFTVFGVDQIHIDIVDLISNAIDNAWQNIVQDGVDYSFNLSREHDSFLLSLNNNTITPMDFELFQDQAPETIQRDYGERAIAKEYSQVTRPTRRGEGNLELIFTGTERREFDFDQVKSQRFHDLVKKRELGRPVNYQIKITRLDRANTAIGINAITNKKCTIFFSTDQDFYELRDSFERSQETIFNFVGCPVMEYGSFDPQRGDIYYLRAT